jgi:outer membrane protein OmpA-like peptidoglycan-associated protein
MKFKQRVFVSIICFSIALLMAACASPKKTVTAPLREITLSLSQAIIIKDHYAFVFETAQCMDTRQFLITDAPYSIAVPEKALKINLHMFTPRAIQTEDDFTGTRTETITALSVSMSVFFPLNSSALDANEAQKFTQFIKKLKQDSSGIVDVTGYTCRLGTLAFNKKLALNRAITIADELKKQGIRVGSVTGKAECGYISDTDPAKNRRVEIIASPPKANNPSRGSKSEGGD